MYNGRRDKVKEYVHDKGEVALVELEQMFPDVSTMTLRRDLIFLEQKGELIRIRGGAKSIRALSGRKEDIYSLRANENIESKIIIAKKAAAYAESGRSIFIDSGSTMMNFCKMLPDENLFVITSGPNIAQEIIKKQNPRVTLIGGQLSRNNISVSGSNSINFIKGINIDIAFLATSGLSIQAGFTSGDFDEAELKKAIIDKARKVILLMDSSKIGKDMPFTFCNLDDVDMLICDKQLPQDIINEAEKKGVELR